MVGEREGLIERTGGLRREGQMNISSPAARETVASSADSEPQSVIGLIRRLADELGVLFRQEFELASSEFMRSLTGLLLAAASVAAGGAVLFAGFLVLLGAAVLGLAEILPAWLAALIVGFVVGIIGFVMVIAGKKKLDPSALKPVRSAESLRRDKEVLARKAL